MPKGNLINFRTRVMSQGAGTLHHEVIWQSSTQSLSDLAHIETREQISWAPAPKEFGADSNYSIQGSHHGLGTNNASGGAAIDEHSVIPTGFKYRLESDGISGTWLTQQKYQMKIDGGTWQDIPGAGYEITRWFERRGSDLIAYCAKRGLTDNSMYREMVHVPGWFS